MEAIANNKKILTNNDSIRNFQYYNPKYIQIYSNVNNINLDFFYNNKPNYQYNDEFSPKHFLAFIEQTYF